MKILVNGEPRDVVATTLEDALSELGFGGRVATAVNEEFVAASQRTSHILKEGDRVEIVAPMQGG